MNKIQQDIDLNLRIIYNSKRHSVMTGDLLNVDGEHMMLFEAKVMADKLQAEGLITREVERCDLTAFGLDVCEAGGWISYKQNLIDQENAQNEFEAEIADLQRKNLELSNEKIEYEKSYRDQEKEIRHLQKIQIWYSLLSGILGLAIGIGAAILNLF